jgi:hypothetical protein
MAEASKKKEIIPIRDFFRTFCDQQAAVSAPFVDFKSLLDQELIVWLVLFRAWTRESVWKLMELDSTMTTIGEAERSKGTIYKMLIPGTPDQLCALFLLANKLTQSRDLAPMAFIVWANVQLAGLINEIDEIMENNNLGKKLIKMVFDRAEFPQKELLDGVQREARKRRRGGDILRPYRHEAQDRDDRRQEILAACVAFQKNIKGTPRLLPEGDFYIPPLPRMAMLPRDRSETLAYINGKFAADDLMALWKDILPYLQGAAEQIPSRGYQAIRTSDAKWKTQKRTGQTVSVEDIHGRVEPPLAYGLLYRRFERQWGEKGIIFLKSLAQGDTVIEASKKACVSRQTGHKYMKDLRREFPPPKKPSKK